MTVSQMLQRVALCVLTSSDCTEDERLTADRVIHTLLNEEVCEEEDYILLCHEELTPSLDEVIRLSLYDVRSVQEAVNIPLWDVLYKEISQEVDRLIRSSAENAEEQLLLTSLWGYSHTIWANCLSKYPDKLFSGLSVLKKDLPKPLSWRLYKDRLLGVQIHEAAPLGIIYRVLSQKASITTPLSTQTLKTTIRISAKKLSNSPSFRRIENLSYMPNAIRFLSSLETYVRLRECQAALKSEETARPSQLILAEYKMTRVSTELQQFKNEGSSFLDLDDDDALLP